MRKTGKTLMVGIAVLALLFCGSVNNRQGADAAAPAPRALLVIAFGPHDSLRGNSVADVQAAVELLREYGFEVTILDAWDESGGMIECPHHQLHQHLDNKRFNLVIYYGHGNAGRWAWCLPQDTNWASHPDTPQGRDESEEFGDHRRHWLEEIQLAPDAMIILRHTCYSHGLEAADMQGGAPLLSGGEVLYRVNEYSYTFLYPNTGIKAYAAIVNVGATRSYLENLFKNHNAAIGELTVSDHSASHQPGDGYELLTGTHYYLPGEGMTYRKNRFPGGTNQAVWSQPAWAGDPDLSISDVCGHVPGDWNGDGDNTDLGEPCFPHDYRDVFDAEDTSYNFFPFLCIANPNAVDTWGEVTFYDEEGEYLTVFREVPADSRITLDFNANRYLRDKNMAVRVRSVDGLPLLAERPMYFRYHGWMDGGSDAFGCLGGDTSWYFPEGYTSETHPFWEYICLGNFGGETARGTMTLLRADGEPIEVSIEIAPGSRQTQCINTYLEGEVSVKVETDSPIVAERSVYFRYHAIDESFTADGGHTKPGLNSLSCYWYFAEGHVGDCFEEWISLANPNNEPTTAAVTCYTPAGKYCERKVTLPPETRKTVLVNDDFPAPGDVSVVVEAGLPIACERAMYFDYNGTRDGGHASPGNTAPSREWKFAEGSCYPGIDEYILLVNPGDRTARVDATYLLGPGEGTYTAVYHVGPEKRITICANCELAPYGNPSQVALKLVSDQPIVAERAMYFDMGRGENGGEPIRGGHVSLGVNEAAAEWYFAETYTGF